MDVLKLLKNHDETQPSFVVGLRHRSQFPQVSPILWLGWVREKNDNQFLKKKAHELELSPSISVAGEQLVDVESQALV